MVTLVHSCHGNISAWLFADSLCSPNTEGANRKLLEVFEDLSQEDGASKSPSPCSQSEQPITALVTQE